MDNSVAAVDGSGADPPPRPASLVHDALFYRDEEEYLAGTVPFLRDSLKAGVPLDEVSVAVGHSTPAVTKRHYAHFVRKTFNPVLRQGITAGK